MSWVENVLLIYYASSDLFVCLHWKNSRFTAFLDSNLHTRLAIVTEDELGLAFPPRNLPKKFRPDPSTFYLVVVVTNRQTDKQTNAGKNIIPRFRGDNDEHICCYVVTSYSCARQKKVDPLLVSACSVCIVTTARQHATRTCYRVCQKIPVHSEALDRL